MAKAISPSLKQQKRNTVKSKGSGAVAQGKQAKAAGKRAVIVDGDNTGSISTGDTVYQTIIQQASPARAPPTCAGPTWPG